MEIYFTYFLRHSARYNNPWSGSVSWCLAEGHGNGDQRRTMSHSGSGRNLSFFKRTTAKSTEEINVREGYLTSRKQPQNDFVKRWSFSSCKVRLTMVDNLTGGTTRRLVSEERRARRPGRSATRLSGPRYYGAMMIVM